MATFTKKGGESNDLNIPFEGIRQSVRSEKRSSRNETRKEKPRKPRRDDSKPFEKISIGPTAKKKKDKPKLDPQKISQGMNRFFINSGTKFGLTPESLNEFIKTKSKSKISKIQSIEIMKKFSFFET